jgi:hypothetical protein
MKREITKEEALKEARRYLANAKDILKKVPVENNRYQDDKYVRTAAGIAYLAPLKAIDGYYLGKKRSDDKMPESIEHYREIVRKHHPNSRRILDLLDTVYENLHILAYYRGGTAVKMVKEGLDSVKTIIDEMEPPRQNSKKAK